MGICSAARISLGTIGLATVVLFSLGANAQTAKVVKVSGKKAIVQFPDDARPRVGQTIDLSGGGGGDMGGGGGGGSRATIIGGSAALSNLTTTLGSNSASETKLDVSARYGWNMGVMEYGAVAGFSYESEPATSKRILSAGGFFDYNLVPNTVGTMLVYGLGAEGTFGSTSDTTASNTTSGTSLTLQAGGQMKWFPLGNDVAIRGDFVYSYNSIPEAGTSRTISGFVVQGGLYVYF